MLTFIAEGESRGIGSRVSKCQTIFAIERNIKEGKNVRSNLVFDISVYVDMEEVEVVKWDKGRENSEDPLRDETICDFRASS